MIKLAIADEQGILREGLASSLAGHPEIKVTILASSGTELLEMMEEEVPDVVSLGLKMNGVDGCFVCEQVKKRFPKVKVIVLSMIQDLDTISHLVSKGANAYLLKSIDMNEMITAIKTVFENNYYFTPLVSEALANFSKNPGHVLSPVKLLEQLSPKEKQILQLICLEHTTKQMAYILQLSPRTIEFHRKGLLEKTNSNNIAGLVTFAFRSGFMELYTGK